MARRFQTVQIMRRIEVRQCGSEFSQVQICHSRIIKRVHGRTGAKFRGKGNNRFGVSLVGN